MKIRGTLATLSCIFSHPFEDKKKKEKKEVRNYPIAVESHSMRYDAVFANYQLWRVKELGRIIHNIIT